MTAGKQKVLNVIRKKLVMNSRELLKYLKNNVGIKRMADAGEIISLGNSLYSCTSIDPLTASIIAVARYYKNIVISRFCAAAIYEITDEPISRIDVDIERDKSLINSLMSVHRVSKKHLVGITHVVFYNEKIRIYDIERTLCDLYKADPEGPIFYKALKRYIARYEPDSTKIQKYDEILKTKCLKHLRQELADE